VLSPYLGEYFTLYWV